MFRFVFTNIMMLSLGIMLYMLVRSLPRIEDDTPGEKRSILERWLASEIPERIDRALHISSTKILRRTRVLVLKADNVLSGKLQEVSQKQKAPSLSFEELQNAEVSEPVAPSVPIVKEKLLGKKK